VIRDRSTRKLWLGQPRYVQSLLEQFGMLDCKPRVAPLDTGLQLSKDGEPVSSNTPYNALIGSLLSLGVCVPGQILHMQ
jgi:hypothetical protein